MRSILRKLGLVARLMIDWDLFKRALDAAVADPVLRARGEAAMQMDPALAAQVQTLKALWAPVEADLRALRGA
ncbi:MAG: hypothetical protein NT029_10410 [Armatimonadetes bacterium]|jgi:hypothetical protein|nr:hypothetical protein [Armatimonadota bacterium]